MSIENIGTKSERIVQETEFLEEKESFDAEQKQVGLKEEEVLPQVQTSESMVLAKIAAVANEIKELKSPEEIQKEIERLQKEYEEKKEAYQSFTHVSKTDSGMGNLGSFNSGNIKPSELEAKFPGIGDVLEMIKMAEKKNSVGLKFWKNPELDDFQLKVIKNYLTTGSMGRFTSPKMEYIAKKTVSKFLEENKNSEIDLSNVKQIIWGEHDKAYYEGTISDLSKQLSKMSENK